MDKLSYISYFYLSLFSQNHSKKASTIYHILSGKKTASILYGAEKYQLTQFFALFSKLDRTQFKNDIDILVRLKYLLYSEEKDGYFLSAIGKKEYSEFFTAHYYPKHLNHLQEGLALNHFWRTLQLITQVLSEIRYKNKSYIPIEKEWEKQIWLKQWLKKNEKNKQELALQFGKEWMVILNRLPLLNAEIITANLSGHKTTGKTQKQLAENFKKETVEISLIILDSLVCIRRIIEQQSENLPLFFSVYKDMFRAYDGMTKSAGLTKRFLSDGYSLDETAKQRQLKESTVNEHIIEISIMDPLFDLSTILPTNKLEEIKQILKETSTMTYQDLIEKKPEVTFLWYRLAQIERNRESDKSRKNKKYST